MDLSKYNSLAPQNLDIMGSMGSPMDINTGAYGATDFAGKMTNSRMQGFEGSGLGLNVPTIGLALNGLGTIGSLWAAFKGLGLAKEKFAFEKNVTDTNMANSIKSYNTTLADKARARAATEGRSQDEADAYVAKNSVSRAPM